MDWYANPYGWARGMNAQHVYDASFVKLREVSLGYDFPESLIGNSPLTAASVSLVGRNLWIISKILTQIQKLGYLLVISKVINLVLIQV